MVGERTVRRTCRKLERPSSFTGKGGETSMSPEEAMIALLVALIIKLLEQD